MFSSKSKSTQKLQAIVLNNILYMDSEEHGETSTLTFYPSDSNNCKVIEVSGDHNRVRDFFNVYVGTQHKCLIIPKNLTMKVKKL